LSGLHILYIYLGNWSAEKRAMSPL